MVVLTLHLCLHIVVNYLPKLGEGELSSPHLTLAAETVSADELEPK